MKKGRKILFVTLLLAVALCFTSCAQMFGTKWTFENHTSATIYVTISNGDPKSLTLYSYDTGYSYVLDDTIYFSAKYTGSSTVSWSRVSGENTIVYSY